MAPIALQ